MDAAAAHSAGHKRRRPDTAGKSSSRTSDREATTAPRHKRFEGKGSDARGRSESRPSTSHSARPAREEDVDYGVKPVLDVTKYTRGASVNAKKVNDLKLKSSLKRKDVQYREAATAAARAELLNTQEAGYLEAEGMERTYRFKQRDIAAAVDIGVAKKAVDLSLDTYGPYHLRYSRTGRHMVMGGEKGHLAIIDWNTNKLTTEFHVGETVHDVSFLHNQTLFAVAQKKYAYIYDNTGMEIHCLKNHVNPLALEFLPYHFLLASVGNAGFLKYQDTSTGALVAEHFTKLGSCDILRQNPWNAVLACGHNNGTVTMWTPNMNTPVVKMLVHRGPVTAMAVDPTGKYLISAGMDSRVKVWDIRKFSDEPVFNYFTPMPARNIDISQRGMVAIGFGSHVQVWGRDFGLEHSTTSITSGITPAEAVAGAGVRKVECEDDETEHLTGVFKPGKRPTLPLPKGVSKAISPYLRHELPGKMITTMRFRPFDDILAVGHSLGINTLIVPGAGEPNFDSMEADPFQAQKARKEAEVHALLDKLAPATITLDPTMVGRVDRAAPAVLEKERKEEAASRAAPAQKDKKKTRGRSKSERKKLKRTANVITAERVALLEKRTAEKLAERERLMEETAKKALEPAVQQSALNRFYKKSS